MRCNMFAPPKLRGKYLDKVLSSGWYTVGDMNERLLRALGEFWGVPRKHLLLTSSATAACMAVMTEKVAPCGCRCDEVYVTKATFSGIHHVCPQVEHDPSRLNSMEAAIITDIGGARPIDEGVELFSNQQSLYAKRRIWLRDICHSWILDTRFDFCFASFYPTKLVPGAEGGVLYCRDPEDRARLRWMINCGIVPGTGVDGGVEWGYPLHMGDVQAALNLEALENSPAYMQNCWELWQSLAKLAKDRNLPYREQPLRPYLFQLEVNDVPEFRKQMRACGYPTQCNFPPAPLVTLPMDLWMSVIERTKMMDTAKEIVNALSSSA